MQLKLFILPMKNLDAAEGEMNGFLRSHRVLAAKKEFVADGENSFWTFCVEYLDSAAGAATWPGKGPKVDYKEVPSPHASRQWAGFPPQNVALATMLVSKTTIIAAGRARLGQLVQPQRHPPLWAWAGSGCAPAGWRTVLA